MLNWLKFACLQSLNTYHTKKRLIERSLTHTDKGQKESSGLVMWTGQTTGQTGSSGSGLDGCTLAQARWAFKRSIGKQE